MFALLLLLFPLLINAAPVLADCRAHGFRELITKPYTMEELGLVVGRAMA